MKQEFPVKVDGKFRYIETGGSGEVLILLHGLFGALSNFEGILRHMSPTHNVVVPILPIYEMPLLQVSVKGLVEHVQHFVDFKGFRKVHVLGNSLGGHVAIMYTLNDPDRVNTLCLTGSSGLYESAMGNTFPKRGDYEYIRKKTQETFYNPDVATKALIDEVYGIVNDRSKVIRVLATAKSAIRHNVGDRLYQIQCPTLLIWGKEDIVTPVFVAHKFNDLIAGSELHVLEKCGHAPMMELPDAFNEILFAFLRKHDGEA